MVLDRVSPIKYISDCSCQLFSLFQDRFVAKVVTIQRNKNRK